MASTCSLSSVDRHNFEITSWPGPRRADRATSHMERACCSRGCFLAPCLTLRPTTLQPLHKGSPIILQCRTERPGGEVMRWDALIDSLCSFPSMPRVGFMPRRPIDVYSETCPRPHSQPGQQGLWLTTHRLRIRSFLRFTISLSTDLRFFGVLSEACWEDRRGGGRMLTQALQVKPD